MQSLEAKTEYRNSFHCGARIFSEEGILKFWKGATPRLARLVVCPILSGSDCKTKYSSLGIFQLSGGIVFTVYEKGLSTSLSLGSVSEFGIF